MRTMILLGFRRAFILRIALLLLPAIVAAGPARGASDPVNPDWPCIQPKVPEISAGMVWAGPEVQEKDKAWKESARVAELVRAISVRRLPIEDAQTKIDRFAETLGTDKDAQLTTLFSGVLQTINAERTEIVAGIERYTRRQAALADKIQAAMVVLNALRKKQDRSEPEQSRLGEVEEQLTWETRIFDERRQSLSYVCESPVLLEQRLFSLARHIMSRLD